MAASTKTKPNPAALAVESVGTVADVKAATKTRRAKWRIDTDYPVTDTATGGKVRIVRSVKTGRPMGEHEPTPGQFANVEVPVLVAFAAALGYSAPDAE